jgi:hypothetical protein
MYTNVSVRSVCKILAYFKSTGSVNIPNCKRPHVHWALCNYDVEVCHPVFMCLLSQISCSVVYVQKDERMSRSIPGQIAIGASGDLWDLSIDLDNLENTRKGWLYNEKGVHCILHCACANDHTLAYLYRY